MCCNPPAAELLGAAVPDVTGRRLPDIVRDSALAAVVPVVERVIRTRRARGAVRLPATLAVRGPVRVSAAPTGPLAGGAILVTLEPSRAGPESVEEVGSALDAVTGHRAGAEQQIRQANEELRSANEELTAANEQLQAKIAELAAAEQSGRRKDEFLAMLAHELRNPLAPILTAMHVIHARRDADPVVGQARRVVERQVKHLARLLDDLLDVSRISRGKIELRRESVDLRAAVGEAVETNRQIIESAGHRVSVQFPDPPVLVLADPTRLVQMVGNLVNNAAKYTPPGGEIVLSGSVDDGQGTLRVRDSGVGIASDMLPRVFDLFQQAEHSLARSRGGLGIGLTLVKHLAELHAGSIVARSPGLGRGSEFVLRLPLAAARDPRAATASQPVPSRQRRVVLIIEDNRDAAEMLRTMLELEGHKVHVARSGVQGVEVARRRAPDVVLLDIGLPGMDGYEVARRIRASFGTVLRLVALTGYGDAEARDLVKAAGFDRHLVKPVQPAELLRIVAGEPAADSP